jgi:hypothetical protein
MRASTVGLEKKRPLYPNLRVVTEDYENDCYLVAPSRAATSLSFDMLTAFRKSKGEWSSRPRVSLMRLRPPNSVEFTEGQAANHPGLAKSKSAAGPRPKKTVHSFNAELAIRPLTTAFTPANSEQRRPPTGVRGRTKEAKRAREDDRPPPIIASLAGDIRRGHILEECTYPGESETLVMRRNESSLRHPEAYARWVGSIRRAMQEMALHTKYSEHVQAIRSKSNAAFHDELHMLSEDVFSSVQLQLDYVRSEVAGLFFGGGIHVVSGASAFEGFVAKYGQRKAELAMLRKHLFDEHWNLKDTPDLKCDAGANGLKVWINGLVLKRFSLRHNAHVQRAMTPFFGALKNSLGQVTRAVYCMFNVKVYRALLPVFDYEKAILVVSEDWDIDSGSTQDDPKPFIHEQQFFTSLFELADNWCEEPSVSKMVAWLHKLRIALFDYEDKLLNDEFIVHDERFWFDGVDTTSASLAQILHDLDSQGTRNVMFRAIQSQQMQDTRYRASKPRVGGMVSRPKAGYRSIAKGRAESESLAQRPQSREAFNINVGGRRVSLIQTYKDGESPLHSYLNDLRIPNVWAAELKALADAHLQQAAKEHGFDVRGMQDGHGDQITDLIEGEGEGWSDSDNDDDGGERSRTPAQVYLLPEESENMNAVDENSLAQAYETAFYEQGDFYNDVGVYQDTEEVGLTLAPEFFDDLGEAGDVGKLRRLHEIIYGRAKTPSDIVGLHARLEISDDVDASCTHGHQVSTLEASQPEACTMHSRWAKVGKPSRKEWARFKLARFKEREIAHNKKRSGRSLALQSYFKDKELEQNLGQLKSFAEREEEKAERRRQASVAKYQSKRMGILNRGKAEIAKRLQEIAEVLDGGSTVQGLYHGAAPLSRGAILPKAGHDFPSSDTQEQMEATIDVPKIVESRLARMGLITPAQQRHSSRPETSSSGHHTPGSYTPGAHTPGSHTPGSPRTPLRLSTASGVGALYLIDERHADDEPVLGWSSGMPAPVSTPVYSVSTADSSAVSMPTIGAGGAWKRIGTPSPTFKPTSPSFAPPVFSPSLVPLKEGSERNKGRHVSSGSSETKMISREEFDQRKKLLSAGSALDAFAASKGFSVSRGLDKPSRSSKCDATHVRPDERSMQRETGVHDGLGMWEQPDNDSYPTIDRELLSSAPPSSGPWPKKSLTWRPGMRTPSMLAFQDRQKQFQMDWDTFRELRAEVDGDTSDDEVNHLPKLALREKTSKPRPRTKPKSRGGSKGGK